MSLALSSSSGSATKSSNDGCMYHVMCLCQSTSAFQIILLLSTSSSLLFFYLVLVQEMMKIKLIKAIVSISHFVHRNRMKQTACKLRMIQFYI